MEEEALRWRFVGVRPRSLCLRSRGGATRRVCLLACLLAFVQRPRMNGVDPGRRFAGAPASGLSISEWPRFGVESLFATLGGPNRPREGSKRRGLASCQGRAEGGSCGQVSAGLPEAPLRSIETKFLSKLWVPSLLKVRHSLIVRWRLAFLFRFGRRKIVAVRPNEARSSTPESKRAFDWKAILHSDALKPFLK